MSRIIRIPPKRQISNAERTKKILELKRKGWTLQAIGDKFNLSAPRIHQIYTKALKDIPVTEMHLHRQEQLERLDAILVMANQILEKQHILVSNGQVIKLNNKPVEDHDQVLKALDMIIKVETRRARLLGLDAPQKQMVNVEGVKYEVIGITTEEITGNE